MGTGRRRRRSLRLAGAAVGEVCLLGRHFVLRIGCCGIAGFRATPEALRRISVGARRDADRG